MNRRNVLGIAGEGEPDIGICYRVRVTALSLGVVGARTASPRLHRQLARPPAVSGRSLFAAQKLPAHPVTRTTEVLIQKEEGRQDRKTGPVALP